MKSQRLQAHFIKKREIQQANHEKTAALNSYYEKWGRINTKIEHWSRPEYYQEAGEKMKQRLAQEEKEKLLTERQAKLKAKLAQEYLELDRELKEQQRPRSKPPIDLLRSTLSNAEEYKKRADLESTLYSRWRLGFDQEKILKESKNNHQAFAKLSWLDRQLDHQLENERQKEKNSTLALQLEEEKRKHEAYVVSCTKMRDSEIDQLKSLQIKHVEELKTRERELNDSKLMENTLRKKLGEIQKEISSISTINNKRRDRVQALHNYRKIKMLMRERSEAIRRDLQQDLTLLDRISFDRDFDNNEEINYLRQKFQGQYDVETENVRHIESMYESEAKDSLKKQEEKWNDDAMVRERQLRVLMDDRCQVINDRIHECQHRQNELQGLREAHLKAIEDCNQRLKELMNESMITGLESAKNVPFNDQNVGGMVRATNRLAINGIQGFELTVPKYGRKKVAWT